MFDSLRARVRSIFQSTDDTTDVVEEISLVDDSLSREEKERVIELIKKKREEELSKPPIIAIIGKTGVGKSSTINSLFNTNFGVSHFESCTQKATPLTISNGKGPVVIYDMPGLGEDIDKDEEHKLEYRRVLPTCDVVLWIMDISEREMSSQQVYIKEIMSYLDGRLVVCANKSDRIHPADWNTRHNLPSKEQESILEKRIEDIRKRLCKVVPQITEEVIVYYSATKRYKLDILFGAMLQACPKDRGWVLGDRIDLADFTELIDKEVLKKMRNGRR